MVHAKIAAAKMESTMPNTMAPKIKIKIVKPVQSLFGNGIFGIELNAKTEDF